ncbi:uncharacterized protein LOC141901304 [Tubulanus polymorphus]|uniref:uncharacterized protein LOC141901304 n=1 Tax=Tubulanus polymorphus TaxID=672921 RepID=UPI003DA38849
MRDFKPSQMTAKQDDDQLQSYCSSDHKTSVYASSSSSSPNRYDQVSTCIDANQSVFANNQYPCGSTNYVDKENLGARSTSSQWSLSSGLDFDDDGNSDRDLSKWRKYDKCERECY